MKLQIGIIGTGKLGSTLAKRFALAGHQVLCGSRNPTQAAESDRFVPLTPNLQITTIEKSIYKSSVILLAVPGKLVQSIIAPFLPQLQGKTVIDATDPSVNNSALSTILGTENLIRSFHYQSAEVYAQPHFGDLHADLFYCGSINNTSEHHFHVLAASVEMRPVCVGGWEQVELLNSLGSFLRVLAQVKRKRRLGFMLLDC